MKFLALSLLLLLLSSAFMFGPAAVRAEEDEVEDGEDEEKEEKFLTRKLEIESYTNSGAKFKSIGGDDSDLRFELSNDGSGLRLRVRLDAEFNETEWHTDHELNVFELVEYQNQDGVPGYNPKDDLEVSTIDLNKLDYAFTCAQVGSDFWSCTAASSTGVFNMTFYVVGSVQPRPGVPDLMPNGVEFDIHVRKTTANPLALVARFEGRVKVDDKEADKTSAEDDDDVNDKKQNIKLGGAQLSWLKTATLNGQDVPITMFAIDDKDVTFSLDTTDTGDIVWDPFVGVLFNSASSFGPKVAFLVSALLGLLLM